METEVILSYDLLYINEKDYNSIIFKIQEIQKMIFNFKNQLKINE